MPTDDPIESGYWFAMVLHLLAYPVAFVLVIAGEGMSGPVESVTAAIVVLVIFLFGIGCGFVSLFGYYVESKQLRRVEADWVPTWWLYLIGQFFIGPFVPFIYLIQRWRHIGIPWHDAPVLSRLFSSQRA